MLSMFYIEEGTKITIIWSLDLPYLQVRCLPFLQIETQCFHIHADGIGKACLNVIKNNILITTYS